LNAAGSLDLAGEVGTLEAGKRADMVVLSSARLMDLLRVGVASIRLVIKDGREVFQEGQKS
jgi:imidazolonepropionase-like amidohydrolase